MNTISSSGPLLFDVQTDAIPGVPPGRVRVRVVTFETCELSQEEFEAANFRLFDARLPEVAILADAVAYRHRDTGAWDIARERRRQIEAEGFTSLADDDHIEGELATAGRCYLQVAEMQARLGGEAIPYHFEWPWTKAWWKPSADPIRNLVKAGALIAAEIDRLRRKAVDQFRQG